MSKDKLPRPTEQDRARFEQQLKIIEQELLENSNLYDEKEHEPKHDGRVTDLQVRSDEKIEQTSLIPQRSDKFTRFLGAIGASMMFWPWNYFGGLRGDKKND